MTTIAYDGTTLAADTMATSDGLARRTSKLFVSEKYLYGMCGYESEGIMIAKWLATDGDPPTVEDDGVKGIVIERATGKCFAISGKHCSFLPIYEPVFAVGSGRDFAIAAMTLGKTAEQAVLFAAQFDVWTRAPVETVSSDGVVR